MQGTSEDIFSPDFERSPVRGQKMFHDEVSLSVKTTGSVGWIYSLTVLSDDSIISCSPSGQAHRWLLTFKDNNNNNNNEDDHDGKNIYEALRLVGTYEGHEGWISGVVEGDRETIITCSEDTTLREWNTISCECLRTYPTSSQAFCMVKTRNGCSLVCGMVDGTVEISRLTNLDEIAFSFQLCDQPVNCIAELEDGSFVSQLNNKAMRWNDRGIVLQIVSDQSDTVGRHWQYNGVIEMKSDLVVTSVHSNVDLWKMRVWRVSTEECLQSFMCGSFGGNVLKLTEDRVATAEASRFKVWSVTKAECIETYKIMSEIMAMTILKNGSLLVAGDGCLKVLHRRW